MQGRPYQELEDRTLAYAKRIVRFCRSLEKSHLSQNMIGQILKSATSVGANYREANEARTTKEKLYLLYVVKRELKETHYWLNLLEEFQTDHSTTRELVQETNELLNIFMKIIFTLQQKK